MENKRTRKKKSPVIKYATTIVKDTLKRLKNDECDEADVAYMISRLNAESKGYHNENSYVNGDEAARIMHMADRNRCRALLASHGICQNKINNQKVGYLRSEVEDLAYRLRYIQPVQRKERKKREPKTSESPFCE